MARKRSGRFNDWPMKLICTAIGACFASTVYALPTAPSVVNGTATFLQEGNALTVTNSNRAIINWQGFSIGSNESVRFVQPSSSSSVMNRVLAADPSVLLGSLSSNGRIFLINPAGILVGAGARIDTAGFIASTLNLSNDDFLANRLNFVATPNAGKLTVENGAEIRTPSGGQVYLVAPQVENAGLISTPQGEVILAAGQQVEIIDSGTPGVRVAVSSGGEALNVGQLMAESGRVGMVGAVVRQQGTASASSVVREGGRIFLKASQSAELAAGSTTAADGTQGGRIEVDGGGRTIVSGKLSATGSNGKGGEVTLLGDKVGLFDAATVDASGETGGGTILVGGDYQGSNPDVRNAQVSFLGNGVTLRADARGFGNGGKVIVWADDTTRAYGSISARGGALGGDGGFVEVSGKRYLDYLASVDLRAPRGKAGTLLLDPNDITINDSAGEAINGTWSPPGGLSATDYAFESSNASASTFHWSTITGQLALGNVILSTSGPGTANGDITFASNMYSYSSTNSLSFLAHRNITFNGGGLNNSAAGDIRLVAGWNGNFVTPLASGTSGSVLLTNSYIYTQGGLKVLAKNNITLDATNPGGSSVLSSYGSSQWIEAGGDVRLLGGIGGQGIVEYYGGGTQTIKGINIEVKADPNLSAPSSNYWSKIYSSSNQTIEASGTITVAGGGSAGNGGHDNYAEITAYGTQYVRANSILLTGGAGTGPEGYNNFATISQESTGGSQKIEITGGGLINLQGGTGTGTLGYAPTGCVGCPSSNNHASIRNRGSGGQEIDFIAGGSLQLNGGSSGNNNFAAIEHSSTSGQQKIWSSTATNPAISLAGGNTGGTTMVVGGQEYLLGNGAQIYTKASQVVKASNILMNAGTGTATGAFIEAEGSQEVVATGNVTLSGGNGSLENEASISSETSQLITITGNLQMTGGGGGASPAGAAMITAPTQDITVGGSATMTAGNSNATGLYGMGAGAVIGWDSGADVFLDVTGAFSMGGTNATNQAMVGSAVGNATVEIRASAITTTANTTIGNWDGSMGGSVELIANSGAISLPANSTLRTGSLAADAGSSISMLGNNYVNNVDLIAAGPVTYHTANTATTHIESIDATGNIVVTGDAGSTSIALGTLTTTGAASISVSAQGQILDDNGSNVANLTTGSGNVQLTSMLGTPTAGTLAISADVATTGTIAAGINGGPYGSISVRDVGATAASNVTINASAATTEGSVEYFRYGNLTLGSGTGLMITPKTGTMTTVAASGDMTIDNSFTFGPGGSPVTLAAGGNLDFASGTVTISGDALVAASGNLTVSGGNVSLQGSSSSVAAGGLLDIQSGQTITAGMGGLSVGAGSINVAGTLSGFGDTSVSAGSMTVDGGNVLSTSGNLSFVVNGLLTVTGGGSISASQGLIGDALGGIVLGAAAGGSGTIRANNGIVDLLVGGTGIEMYNGSYLESSYDGTGLIKLFFPGLSGGGSMIDGAATFDGGYRISGNVVTVGAGLEITYGILSNPVADAINGAISSAADSAGSTSDSGGSTTLALSSGSGDPATGSTFGGETGFTTGGTTGTFGDGEATTTETSNNSSSTTGSSQDSQNAKKKPAQCRNA